MKKEFPCPHCKKTSSITSDNPWRPFCSERCRLIDLGDWMDEKNRIASGQSEAFTMDVEDEEEIRH